MLEAPSGYAAKFLPDGADVKTEELVQGSSPTLSTRGLMTNY
jgi:hypothetical protein